MAFKPKAPPTAPDLSYWKAKVKHEDEDGFWIYHIGRGRYAKRIRAASPEDARETAKRMFMATRFYHRGVTIRSIEVEKD